MATPDRSSSGFGDPAGTTEYQIWQDILRKADALEREKPSIEAIRAVITCAQETDVEATAARGSWPEGPEPADARASVVPSRLHVSVRFDLYPQDALDLCINALATSGFCVGTEYVGYPSKLAFSQIVAALNRLPSSGSIAALYLAPVLRRYLLPDATPAWYFRHVTRVRRTRALKPWLIPTGWPSEPPDLPVGYEWDRYEFWCLTAYLAGDEYIQRNPSNARLSRERLKDLVTYAAGRLRQLLNMSADYGLLACNFEDLCGPLRRLLLHVGADPVSEAKARRECHEHLRTLRDALELNLPKTDAQYLPYYYPWVYEINLKQVERLWRETRGTRDAQLRRGLLEKAFPALPILGSTDSSKARLDRFWNRCGDLRAVPASDMAHRLTLFELGLDMTPQRVREILPKLRRRSATGRGSPPQRPPVPVLPVEFV